MNSVIELKRKQIGLNRVLRKWNYSKHDYEPYMVPINWKCKTYCDDLNEAINCVQCGKAMRFGESYTSQEVHTGVGFGYCVCGICHEKEMRRKYQ